MNPEEVVIKQLEYYNSHNLEGFASTYHDDIEIFDFGGGTLILSGKQALLERYKARFEKKVHAEIKNRIVIGSKVIDLEYVTNAMDDSTSNVVAIYDIENDLIKTVHFIYE